tara:strand:- start:14363 stop:14848 length:486 start_codon:yes stop_codon:yes gene_type:complete
MKLAKSMQKILVIDDEPDIGELICEILIPHFETIHYISEADKVAEHLDQVNYDLVLSDINMPKLDGTGLVALLRSKGHLTSTVFVSGNITLEKALMALRLGVADILDKPFTADQLLETVRHVIEIKKRRHQLYELHRDPERAHAESKMIGLFQAKRARKRA